MKIPTIHGYIERRILINFTADPKVVEKILPFPFRPIIYKEKAIVGICLIRLKNIKPKGLPAFVGVNSENGAHRIAVEWDENGETKTGVYIPRRDTSLRLNTLVGGRLFPGKHYYAKFNVKEGNGNYHIDFKSSDDTETLIDAVETKIFNDNSIFETLHNASNFFKNGELGYSPNKDKFEGLNEHLAAKFVGEQARGFVGRCPPHLWVLTSNSPPSARSSKATKSMSTRAAKQVGVQRPPNQ